MGDKKADGSDRSRLSRRGQAAAALLGLTTGVGINLASNLGFRVLAIAAAGTALVMVTNWLRGLPQQAPLVRLSIPIFLCLAGASSFLTLVLPDGWTRAATLSAVGFMAGVILLASAVEVAAQMLAGAASLGLAIAVAAAGVATVHATWGSVAFGSYIASFGLILMATGVHILRGPRTMRGTQIVGIGAVGLGGAATGFLYGGNVLVALVIILGGTVLVRAEQNEELDLGTFWKVTVPLQEFAGFTWCAAGLVGAIGVGVPALLHGRAFDGWAAVALGVAVAWAGLVLLKETDIAMGSGALVLGLTAVAGGTVALWGHVGLPRKVVLVLAVAAISVGLAAAGGGVLLFHRGGLLQRIAGSWRRLIGDPSSG